MSYSKLKQLAKITKVDYRLCEEEEQICFTFFFVIKKGILVIYLNQRGTSLAISSKIHMKDTFFYYLEMYFQTLKF